MYNNPEQAKLASLIISIVILIIIVVLIVVVCCNWNTISANANANTNVPIFQNPQKAALGAYAYNKNNFDAKQRGYNIYNAKQYPGGGSDWANWIQAGTAKNAAVNMQNNFGKVYTNCYTTGKGKNAQVVCTQYVDTPKNQLMGYNHQRLANIQNAKLYPGAASDWADWFQGGQARGIAQNKVYNMQNNTQQYAVAEPAILECPAGDKNAKYSPMRDCTANGYCTTLVAAHSACIPPQSQQCPANAITGVIYPTCYTNINGCAGPYVTCLLQE